MSKLELDINWTGIRYGSERHIPDSPVLVLNGHAYHLIVDCYRDVNDVCKRCALEHICFEDVNTSLLRKLCTNCTPEGAGYWVEDRYPVDLTIADICLYQNPTEIDIEHACRVFDRPMFDHFIKKS